MSITHKVQRSHDLVIDFQTFRAWVSEHCGVMLPSSPEDVQIEASGGATERGCIALTWAEDWKKQDIALPLKVTP